MKEVGAATQRHVVLSPSLRPIFYQNTNSLLCAVSKWTSGLHPSSHMSTKIPHRQPKQTVFFSHGEWRGDSFTELPTWQYVLQLSKSPSCGPKPPLKCWGVHWYVPHLFFVHAKCFCPTIVSVHLGAALSEHDMKSKLDPSLSLHSWPPVW